MDPKQDTPFNQSFSPEFGVNKNEPMVSIIKTRQGATIVTLYPCDRLSRLNLYSISGYTSLQQAYFILFSFADVDTIFHSPRLVALPPAASLKST